MIEWFRKWWWVVALVIVGGALFVLSKGKQTFDIDEIFTAAQAQADAKKLEAKLGRDAAKKQIEEKYAETIEEMDEADKKEAEELGEDPGARSRFYARVAIRRAKRS